VPVAGKTLTEFRGQQKLNKDVLAAAAKTLSPGRFRELEDVLGKENRKLEEICNRILTRNRKDSQVTDTADENGKRKRKSGDDKGQDGMIQCKAS
jgi:hypothetical protein